MNINTEDYMNIASFARYVDKTTAWINTLINRGDIGYILISGIKFINYKEYGKKFGKGENQGESDECGKGKDTNKA